MMVAILFVRQLGTSKPITLGVIGIGGLFAAFAEGRDTSTV